MYVNAPPTFDLNPDVTDGIHGLVEDQFGFSERILEFIENTLNGFENEIILCYLRQPDGIVMEATLEKNGYFKSLQKCLEYYSSIEQYEKCNKIKNLIKKYELR